MTGGSDPLLLDTHSWLWYVTGRRDRAPEQKWQLIETAALEQRLALSDISLWELARLARKRRLELVPNARAWLKDARGKLGLGIIEVDRHILMDSALFDMPHQDPADRILVVTALRYDLRLATADESLLDFAAGHRRLRVLDMRA